jgi:hypothetical protein
MTFKKVSRISKTEKFCKNWTFRNMKYKILPPCFLRSLKHQWEKIQLFWVMCNVHIDSKLVTIDTIFKTICLFIYAARRGYPGSRLSGSGELPEVPGEGGLQQVSLPQHRGPWETRKGLPTIQWYKQYCNPFHVRLVLNLALAPSFVNM